MWLSLWPSTSAIALAASPWCLNEMKANRRATGRCNAVFLFEQRLALWGQDYHVCRARTEFLGQDAPDRPRIGLVPKRLSCYNFVVRWADPSHTMTHSSCDAIVAIAVPADRPAEKEGKGTWNWSLYSVPWERYSICLVPSSRLPLTLKFFN